MRLALIGQMFVEAGLCSSQDVDAALEVQKNVRTELSKMLERGETADAKKVADTIDDAYEAYEKSHPDYHRPSPDSHAQLEVPVEITDAQGRHARIDHVRSGDLAEHALSTSAKPDGKGPKTDAPEPRLK